MEISKGESKAVMLIFFRTIHLILVKLHAGVLVACMHASHECRVAMAMQVSPAHPSCMQGSVPILRAEPRTEKSINIGIGHVA